MFPSDVFRMKESRGWKTARRASEGEGVLADGGHDEHQESNSRIEN